MDKLILGILMLQRMTAYEIKNTIKTSFKSMCSDSLGSIQAALKKMLEQGLVTCEELVEKGVNKKRYAITELGEKALIEWIKVPLDMTKTKNADFGKLLFMGFLPKENQKRLIDAIILSLEEEYMRLKMVKDSIDVEEERASLHDYLLLDSEYRSRIQNLNEDQDISKSIKEVGKFTMATLDYGIDMTEFNIKWFKKLKKRI